jgi:hypothetical protein
MDNQCFISLEALGDIPDIPDTPCPEGAFMLLNGVGECIPGKLRNLKMFSSKDGEKDG